MLTRFALLMCIIVAGVQRVPVSASVDVPPPSVVRWDTTYHPPTELADSPVVYELGTSFYSPRSIDVDMYGRIYVLDHSREALFRFGPAGNLEAQWVCRYLLLYQGTPHGRTVVRVTNNGRILLGPHFNEKNIRLIDPVAGTDATYPVSDYYGGEMDATYARNGSKYYTLHDRRIGDGSGPDGWGSSLWAYSSGGKLLGEYDLPRLRAMTVGPDGLIYATKYIGSMIHVYNSNGRCVREIDTSTSIGQNGMVGNISVDDNGDIYVVRHGYCYHLDQNGNPLARWALYDCPELTAMCEIHDVVVRHGLMYLLIQTVGYRDPTEYSEIQVYNGSGRCIARYIPRKPDIPMPTHLAVQHDGSFCVAQGSASSGVAYDSSGNPINPTRKRPEDRVPSYNNNIPTVSALAICKSGGYYVSNFTLDRSDPNGVLESELFKMDWTTRKPGDPDRNVVAMTADQVSGDVWAYHANGELSRFGPDDKLIECLPGDPSVRVGYKTWFMAVDPAGYLYVPDMKNSRVQQIDTHGKLLTTFGSFGCGIGELDIPKGIAVDAHGRVYVADCGNSRIQVFSRDGQPLGFWGEWGSGDGQLDRPQDIAFGPNNTLWIADTQNGRIVKVPLDRFWREIRQTPVIAKVMRDEKPASLPSGGKVTIEGIVTAGAGDFLDATYIENPLRAWGIQVILPHNVQLDRRSRCKLTGTVEMANGCRRFVVESVDELEAGVQEVQPLGMSNAYVGNAQAVGLTTLGLLVRTWGEVLNVDTSRGLFTISDDSSDEAGLVVRADKLASPLTNWSAKGCYVSVTGISCMQDDGSRFLRIRGNGDLNMLVRTK
ncbi:MAG: hypothetical protein ACYC64_09885 [Armatimonadota bacterium]